MAVLPDFCLLSLQVPLANLLQFSLVLVIGYPRLHNLLDLVLGVLNDFVRAFLFGLKQLDPVVQPHDI